MYMYARFENDELHRLLSNIHSTCLNSTRFSISLLSGEKLNIHTNFENLIYTQTSKGFVIKNCSIQTILDLLKSAKESLETSEISCREDMRLNSIDHQILKSFDYGIDCLRNNQDFQNHLTDLQKTNLSQLIYEHQLLIGKVNSFLRAEIYPSYETFICKKSTSELLNTVDNLESSLEKFKDLYNELLIPFFNLGIKEIEIISSH